MDSKTVICDLRNKFSSNGWILLIYYGITNVSLLIVAVIDAFTHSFQSPLSFEAIAKLFERSRENAWGHLLAFLISGVVLFVWKKSCTCLRSLLVRGKRMSLSVFSALCCAFFLGQAIQMFLMPSLEWVVELFGFSSKSLMVSTAAESTTVGMILYVAVFAPLLEEVLFRGLVLKNLLPYGKKFAIFISSLLFSLIHGSIIQMPFAFLTGLILGYAAAEYGLIWSISLHMFNNLVLGEFPALLTKMISPVYVNLAFYVLIFGSSIFFIIFAAAKWRNIADYCCESKPLSLCLKSFFTAKGVIVLLFAMLINMVSYLI